MNRLGKLMTMMHPEKTQMVTPDEALPGRSEPRLRGARAPRGARHAAEAAVPGGDRGRLLRARLLLGGGAALLGARRRLHDGGRLHERDHPEPDLRGGLQRRRPATPRRCWSPSTRSKISYADLLKVFFEEHDPTQGMRQGNDVGTQYRSGIYFTDDAQKATAEMARAPTTRRCAPPATSRSRPRSSRPGPSTTPRTTTSSTCTRCRTATAASPAPASPAASPPPP